jgi:anti-sigma regulatory factor (Ser/Thr protein kinase)/GNAT superfamily N-acetyltransferase
MKPLVSSLTVPCRLDYLVPLAAFVQELAQLMGFDEKEQSQIRLGTEEAITNVIEHGLELNPDESFTLTLEAAASALTVRIREKGLPFDPARAPQYSPERAGEDTSGLGMFLMRASMDIVEYHNLGRDGKETVLVKHLGSRRIDRLMEPEELVVSHEVPRVTAAPSFTVRRARPEEAVEIAKCAYRAYGYSYTATDYIYFPDKIAEYNASGQMISAVAVTDDGVLMGHAALKRADPDARTAELGVAFVTPEFRGRGLLKQLTDFLLGWAAKNGLEGIFGQAVTSHVASQTVINREGFKDCGLALGMLAGGVSYKAICGDVSQRESLAISYLPLERQRRVVIYPPPRHREFVKKLCERLAVPFDVAETMASEAVGPDQGELVKATKSQAANSAEIRVSSCAEEAFAMTRSQWKKYCQEQTDVVFLYLNIEDPRCPGFAARCEELGFFFAGVQPGAANGREALILQYLNNVRIDYDCLKLYSAEAQELARYIRANDPNAV